MVDAASDVLPMRAGVHWGRAIAVGPDVVGNDVNLAARVVAAANPGEVLVTTQARRAAGDLPRLTFGPVRLLHPKGVAEPMEASAAMRRSELIAADA
jgi:class 3 adenylate cyclase